MAGRVSITETSYGKLRGTVEKEVCVYRGIPFAAPPLGPLRFRPPERPARWAGVRDATRFGPGSYQADRPLAPVLGVVVPEQSEDCLTLNVWRPAAVESDRRPVLVWIHGGAWVIGAGSETVYDGASLVRRGGVVVVTINYRLGPFGFLRSNELGGSLESTGNEAMLDQVAALEWVRDEIATFGGDPSNVTVLGESAGAVNIACLLTMSRARGLFHKAVLESGSLNHTRTPEAALGTTREILQQLGIAPEAACRLRDVPARQLVWAQNAVAGRSVVPPFSPVADGDLIPARPFAAIASGSARGVPLLVGSNLEEMKLYRFLDPSIDALDEAGLVDRCSMLLPGTDRRGEPRGRRLAEVYRAERAARGDDASPAETWLAISTDHFFRSGALKLAELQAAHTPDVFVYEFAWKGTAPGKPQGAIHALEIPFVFGTLETSEIGAIAGRTPSALALSAHVQEAWLAFARTGRPRSAGLPEWPRYAPPRRATLELGERCRLLEAPREIERALCDELIGGLIG
jgi:para-nitrobenzyl esterase